MPLLAIAALALVAFGIWWLTRKRRLILQSQIR